LIILTISLDLSGQSNKNPLEGGIGLALYQNLNTRSYDEGMIMNETGHKLQQDGVQKIYWNQLPTVIREYHIGGSMLLSQTPDFRREWLVNLDITGQFHQHYIVNTSTEVLIEEQIIDSLHTESTYQRKLISIINYNDVLTLRPSLSWKHHVNRRVNIRSDIRLTVGMPIKNGYEINTLEGQVYKTFENGKVVYQDQTITESSAPRRFVQSEFFVAFGTSVGMGIEYRVFENRPVFFNVGGILGRQLHWFSSNRTQFRYAGGEMKIISRF